MNSIKYAFFNLIIGRMIANTLSSKKCVDNILYGRASPSPRELIRIDPNNVKYQLSRPLYRDLSRPRYRSHVYGGDWDQSPICSDEWYSDRKYDDADQRYRLLVEENILLKSLKQHFEDDVAMTNTKWYEGVVDPDLYSIGGRYTSPEDAQKQWKSVRELYYDIAESGYQTQAALGKTYPYPEYDEVAVGIGRDGALFKGIKGRHRLFISKILGLNEIPVRVFVRHKEWQEMREQIARADSVGELNEDAKQHLEHPDVRRLAPNQ